MPADDGAGEEHGRHAGTPERRVWRHSWLNTSISFLLLAGLTLLTYPTAAAWVSQQNQSNIVLDQTQANEQLARDKVDGMLEEAEEYNEALVSGALLAGGAHVASGTGHAITDTVDAERYWEILNAQPNGVLARIRIPAIRLDLPVYHGTSDATLLKGVGHLQGTSLPVGGEGTRSVLTGHRGLANAEMFTHLNRVQVGDTFTVEVLGQVYAYRVFETKVVKPEDTEKIRAVPDRDLMTLITCTPLGVNTHRILVTGERITPTPETDLAASNARPDVPGFPWWAIGYVAGLGVIGLWQWRSGYGPRRKTATAADAENA
ncbi:MAG: class C sortase [Leucobacter sp.]|nr:class C sortase [Leucobacter sp.]